MKKTRFASVSASGVQRSVPMFLLVPQVTLRKRLDVAGAAEKWLALLPEMVIRNWRDVGRG